MKRAALLLPILVLAHAAACRAPAAGALTPEVRAQLLQKVTTALQADGANYRSADSGTLAWGEAYLLDAYVWMYRATGDAGWLRRLVKHADTIMANLTPGADGRLGWRTDHYSVAIAHMRPLGRVTSDLRLDAERIYDIKRAQAVTGHRYWMSCQEAGKLWVADLTTFAEMEPVTCTTEKDFIVAPGLEARCDRLPQPGDAWLVDTIAAAPLEYVVHDGMVLQPISHFIRLVHEHPEALGEFREPASRYQDLLERELIPKWDRWWRDFPKGGGAWLAQDDPAQRFPGITLPHNQYLALGRVVINLYRVTGKPQYLDRTRRMATFFKRSLQVQGDHYLWHYWDAALPGDAGGKSMHQVEDSSHGHIDVGFAIECAEAGVVFNKQDLERFRRTLAATINPEADPPAMGVRIGTNDGDWDVLLDWARLAVGDPTLQPVVVRYGLGRALGGHQAVAVAQLLALSPEGK